MSKPTHIRMIFPKEKVEVKARLLWEQAPHTCAALIAAGAAEGMAHQAIYSGSESVFLLDRVLKLEPENATSNVTKGDVAFTWMAAGSSYGVNKDFAEICWFYDIDAQPRMWEGPVAVNVFAKIEGPAESFYAVCYRIRREGVKPFRIEFV